MLIKKPCRWIVFFNQLCSALAKTYSKIVSILLIGPFRVDTQRLNFPSFYIIVPDSQPADQRSLALESVLSSQLAVS